MIMLLRPHKSVFIGIQSINLTHTRFAGSENGWMNSLIALNWLVNNFDPATHEKANGHTCLLFLDGHSLHFSLELLQKAQELNVKFVTYPAHCTHILQGLDVVCLVKLKRELADEIHDWNDCHQQGIQKWDFSGIFGHAYLQAFTPELVKLAWKTVGIYPYNPDIIPLNKFAPSETSTTQLTAANAIHSTPVCNIMSVFSYFNASLKWGSNSNNNKDKDDDGESDNKNNGEDGESDDENDGENDSENDGKNNGENSSKNDSESNNENNNENDDKNDGEDNSKNDEDNDTNNPFLPSFTLRSRMHIL